MLWAISASEAIEFSNMVEGVLYLIRLEIISHAIEDLSLVAYPFLYEFGGEYGYVQSDVYCQFSLLVISASEAGLRLTPET
jgi:hypothetical protein